MTRRMGHLAQAKSIVNGYPWTNRRHRTRTEEALITRFIVGTVPILQGLIHLIGFVVYCRQATTKALSYSTVLLCAREEKE